MSTRLARNITVDYATRELVIDEMVMPFHITPDIEVETDSEFPVARVTVTFLADAAHVNTHLEASLAYVRDLADKHRLELGLPINKGGDK